MCLQDSDKENLQKETLEQQFGIVRDETTTSPVHQFGDLDVAKMTVGQFQGTARRKQGLDREGEWADSADACRKDAVNNWEANR